MISIEDMEEIKAKEGNFQALILLFLSSLAFRIGLIALSFTINKVGTDEEKRQLKKVQTVIDDTENSSVGVLFKQGIQELEAEAEAEIVARTNANTSASTSPSTSTSTSASKSTTPSQNEGDLLKDLEYEKEKLKEEQTLGKEARRLIDEASNNKKCPPMLENKKSPLNEDEFSFFELKEIYFTFSKVPGNKEYGSFFNTCREKERALRFFREKNIRILEKKLGLDNKALF